MPKGVYIRTEEYRKKQSLAHIGKKHSEETKRKLQLSLLNRSAEAKAETSRKLSLAKKGKKRKPFSKEWIRNMSLVRLGTPSWNKGLTKETDERVRKYGLAQLGKKHSESTIIKMRLAHIGKLSWCKGLTKEIDIRVKKCSLARKGRKNDFTTRKNMSLSQLNRSPEAKAETSRKMRLARSKQVLPLKDTSIEVALQNVLKQNNIVFKTHVPLIGQPDIFIEPNICIFVDGDYWHANPKIYKEDFVMFKCKLAQDIWEKDKKVTNSLISKGYKVIRFWETDIKDNIQSCLDKIIED